MTNSHASALHASPFAGAFLVTGGGITLLADLLTEPGASSTVIEASVPYAEESLAEQLGGAPDQACSADTARALAMAAWQRAKHLTRASETLALDQLFGFGCTAALATNRKKRGKHRAFLAVQTLHTTCTAHIEFDKGPDGMGNRDLEEAQISNLAWQLLDEVLDVRLGAEELPKSSHLRMHRATAQPIWSELLSGKIDAAANNGSTATPAALLSGSFNPLHRGHKQMAVIAEEKLGVNVAFELCIDNVDKPSLGYHDIDQRSRQFVDKTLWLTRLPTFIEKARRFPNCTFVVGIDTLVRIGMPRYYASPKAMHLAFEEFTELGTRFLCFGRDTPDDDAGFMAFDSVELPETLRKLCSSVSESEFRVDLSSSQLRRQ